MSMSCTLGNVTSLAVKLHNSGVHMCMYLCMCISGLTKFLTCLLSLYRAGERDQSATVKHGQQASVTSSGIIGKATIAWS